MENATAERINGIIKEEYLQYCQPNNLDEENDTPLQSRATSPKCEVMTPEQVHNSSNKPEQLWKNYLKKTIDNQEQD